MDQLAAASGRWNGSSNQNALPTPSVLVAPMRPPISSVSCLLMASPSPVPPKRRVMPLQVWQWQRQR